MSEETKLQCQSLPTATEQSSPQIYPTAGKEPTPPCAEDVARMDYMNTRSPTRPLPDGPLVVKVASQAQVVHLRHVSDQWDDKILSFANFMMVEDELAAMPFGRRGKRYVLVPGEEEDSLSIRCSAHLREVPAFLAIPGQPIQIVSSTHGASLGTPLELRKRGYASTLVTELNKQLAPLVPGQYKVFSLQTNNAAIYKNMGQVQDGITVLLKIRLNLTKRDVQLSDYNDVQSSTASDSQIEEPLDCEKNNTSVAGQEKAVSALKSVDLTLTPITESNIDAVIAADEAFMMQECQKLAAKIGQPVFSYVPLAECMRYQSKRCALKFQHGYDSASQTGDNHGQMGNYVGQLGQKNWGFVLWRISVENRPRRERDLCISRVRYSSASQLQVLLQSVLDVCLSWELDGGARWTTSSDNIPALEKLEIPYMKLLGNHYFPITRLSGFGSPDNIPHRMLNIEKYYLH